MTKVLKTPDERFPDLPNFPYSPTYMDDLNGTVPDPMSIQKPDILYRNGVKRSPEERWQPLTDKTSSLRILS